MITKQRPHYEFHDDGLSIESRGVISGELSEYQLAIPTTSAEAFGRVENARKYTENGVGRTIINPQDNKDTGKVIFHGSAWGGANDNQVAFNELAAIASANPGATIVSVDSPGAGASDTLPHSVSKETAKTGSYKTYGEYYLGGLENLMSHYDTYNFIGHSEGARRLLGVVACFDDMAGKVYLTDPVGSHQQSVLRLMKSFMMYEGGHSAKYVKASPDIAAAKAQEALDSPKNIIPVVAKLAINGGLWNQFVREPRAMAKDSLAEDLEAALPNIEDELRVYTPEFSGLTNADNVQVILENAIKAGVNPSLIIEHCILKLQTHAFFASNPGAAGAIFKLR